MFAPPIYLIFAIIVLFLALLLVLRTKSRISETLFGWAFDAGLCLLMVPPVLFANVSAIAKASYIVMVACVFITFRWIKRVLPILVEKPKASAQHTTEKQIDA